MKPLQRINNDLDRIQALQTLRAMAFDGNALTLAQQGLYRTQLSLLCHGQQATALLPSLEGQAFKDLLVMEDSGAMVKRFLKVVLDTLWTFIRQAGAWIVKLVDRTRGLRFELANLKREYAKVVGRTARTTTIELAGDDAAAFRQPGMLSLDVLTLGGAYTNCTELASIVLNGSYTKQMQQLGDALQLALNDSYFEPNMKALESINSVVGVTFQRMGNELQNHDGINVPLPGLRELVMRLPKQKVGDAITVSRNLQGFLFEVRDNGIGEDSKVFFQVPTLEQLGVLIGKLETGLDEIEAYNKSKIADRLLKQAGELHRRLNDVYRQQSRSAVGSDTDDSMVALSRYLTAYTAWVQTPMVDYASYFTSLSAATMKLTRRAVYQFV